MHGQDPHGAHGQTMRRSRTFPSHICPSVSCMWLTARLSEATVGFRHHQGEQLLCS